MTRTPAIRMALLAVALPLVALVVATGGLAESFREYCTEIDRVVDQNAGCADGFCTP